MPGSGAFFDGIYRGNERYYGHEVRPEFAAFVRGLPRPRPRCLDLGAGQGRHALFAAAEGARVHAVDYSVVAAAQLRETAERARLPITVEAGDATRIALPANAFDAAFLVSFLSHLERPAIPPMIGRVLAALAPGGRAFVEAFTVDDPGFRAAPDASETAGALRHYMEAGELRTLFSDYAILEYREFVEDDLTHGPAHRHGVALLVAAKPASAV